MNTSLQSEYPLGLTAKRGNGQGITEIRTPSVWTPFGHARVERMIPHIGLVGCK